MPRDLGEWHAVRQYFEGVADARLWVLFERDLLPGYAWVFPLGDGRANVGYGVLRADGRSGRALKALWPDLLSRPVVRAILGPDARPCEQVHAWPIPTRYSPTRLMHGPRVSFVGDAAGVVDPMTGEGIAQAIETGMLAAHAIATGANYPALVHRALGRDLRFAGVAPTRAALAARRPGRDPRRRPHALDAAQLRALDVGGLSPCNPRHARPLAARRASCARRVAHVMMR